MSLLGNLNKKVFIIQITCKLFEIFSFNGNYLLQDNSLIISKSLNQFLIFLFLVVILIQSLNTTNSSSKDEVYKLSQLLGGIYLLISNDLLISIIAWEFLNFSIYFYQIGNKEARVFASLLKYILLSGYIFSFFLLILSFIYYTIGSFNYSNLHHLEGIQWLIQIPLLFKLNIIPFHNWAPDLYNTLNYYQNIWLLIIPKLFLFYFLIQLQSIFQFGEYYLLFIILSILIGSFSLFSQNLIKRFFIYSSITQFGYLFLFLIIYSTDSANFSLIYLLIYSLNFFSILILFLIFPVNYLHELKGLTFSHSILSYLFFINLFSLAGFPPFNGFFLKFELIDYIMHHSLATFLIQIIIIFSLFNTVNYLKLIEISSIPQSNIKLQNLNKIHPSLFYLFSYSSLFNLVGFFNLDLLFLVTIF